MKNKILYVTVSLVCILVVMLGVSLAYFMANVDESEGADITLELKDLKVILTDGTEITNETIEPGWSTSKTFTVENESDKIATYNIGIENLINTFVTEEYLQYKITSSNGYNMTEYAPVPKSNTSTKEVLAYNISIEGNTTHEYRIEFRYVETEEDQSADMGKMLKGNIFIEEGSRDPNSLYSRLLTDNQTILTRTDFNTAFITTNTGTLYVAEDPWTEDTNGDGVGETVYYFAGNAQNNWVKFGKNSSNNDLYWRIIRTNEDGSVRLLYVGTETNTTTGYIGGTNYQYNSTDNNTMYVGYMYGSSGSLENNRTNDNDSTIKRTIDNWYNSGLNTKTDGTYTYDDYVSRTAIYCNDRATSAYLSDVGKEMYYSTRERLEINKQPSYKCGVQANGTVYSNADSADKFSASVASGGNGQLEFPVALMTADEVAFAGGVYATNAAAWYYYNSANGSVTGVNHWWTMSPYSHVNNGYSRVFLVISLSNPGYLTYAYVSDDSRIVRPALSLKSCVTWKSGNGSSSSPYEVQISSTCASLEN